MALKAQAAALPHKSDAGGVVLGMESEAAVAEAWSVLQNNIERLRPGLMLDGVLVERMGEKGLELIVGARNDQDWGPVLLVGSGGVLAEAIEDVRILAADLPSQRFKKHCMGYAAARCCAAFAAHRSSMWRRWLRCCIGWLSWYERILRSPRSRLIRSWFTQKDAALLHWTH